jgi:hypothetical protein
VKDLDRHLPKRFQNRIKVIIFAGHGDINRYFEYQIKESYHLISFRNLAKNFLPKLAPDSGIIISACYSMGDPTIYQGIYSGGAWLAGYPDTDDKGEFGVRYTDSAIEEMQLLSDITRGPRYMSKYFKQHRKNKIQAIKFI